MPRLRINIGNYLSVIACLVLALALACPDAKAESIFFPNALPRANGSNWKTTFFAQPDASAPARISIAPCRLYPCDTEIEVAKPTRYEVTAPGFGTAWTTTDNAFSVLKFDDGRDDDSYTVKVLHPFMAGDSWAFDLVSSDAQTVLTVNVFSETLARFVVEFIDDEGAFISEPFDVKPGATQYAVKGRLRVGAIRVSSVPCFACDRAPAYFFVAVSDRRGGNARVKEF